MRRARLPGTRTWTITRTPSTMHIRMRYACMWFACAWCRKCDYNPTTTSCQQLISTSPIKSVHTRSWINDDCSEPFVSWIDARSPRRSHQSPSQTMYALSLRRAPLLLARLETLTSQSGLPSSLGHLAAPLSSLPQSLPQATLSHLHLRSIHCYTFASKNVSKCVTSI